MSSEISICTPVRNENVMQLLEMLSFHTSIRWPNGLDPRFYYFSIPFDFENIGIVEYRKSFYLVVNSTGKLVHWNEFVRIVKEACPK